MSDILGTGTLGKEDVTATLRLGDAILTLTFPRDNEQAAADMADLVERSEDAFIDALEALVAKAEAQEAPHA